MTNVLTCMNFIVGNGRVLIMLSGNGGHIVSAQPASACASFATKTDGLARGEEDAGTQVASSPQGSCATAGTNIWTRTREAAAETEPPQQKKAKRGAGEEEQEEGEIAESSDEEMEDARTEDEIRQLDKSGDADNVD